MRSLKFILSALAILLAGALAAGLAARAVVAPRTDDVVSAGVLTVPSVLGQTADEALFYPWSLYDPQSLAPISEDELAQYEPGNVFTSVAIIGALGADFDLEELVKSQMTSCQDSAPTKISTSYLKDYPAVLPEGNVPVLLSYAASEGSPFSVSWLLRARTEAELSEIQRQAALNNVKNDLAGLLWHIRLPYRNYSNDLMDFLERFGTRFLDLELESLYARIEYFILLLHEQYGGGESLLTVDMDGKVQFPVQPSLEELLALGEGGPVSVQFISTPRQIVLLFNVEGMVMGVYYDIQLERYSGFGLSVG